jgi:hypothetical protein
MLIRSLAMLGAAALYGVPEAYDATRENTAQPCRIMRTVFQQGNCSACAAFASSSALSMRLCLMDKQDFIPSPYRLFDCVSPSCENGTSLRLTGAALMQGIPDVAASPQVFGLGCQHSLAHPLAALLFGYLVAFPDAMKLDILFFGPSIVAVYANQALVRYTEHSVYVPEDAPPDADSRHSVVIVGWGAHPEPHWVVLNSWGQGWGDGGKAKVALRAFDRHYSWRTKGLTMVESCAVFAYFGFLFFLVAACAVMLPEQEEEGGDECVV